MPDEFPTLEVVALIGVVAAFVRTLQLRSGLREVPKLAAALEAALRAGDLGKARALCGHAEGAAFARVGLGILDALGKDPRPDLPALKIAVAHGRKRAEKAVQRGRGRDLVVAAVLIGAGAYAVRASLGVGTAFYALVGTALFVTGLGPVLRRSLMDQIVRASDQLLAAAGAYLAVRAAPRDASCPECGSQDTLRLGAPALDAVRDLGLGELKVCRQCGLVRGRAAHPEALVPDPARGLELASSAVAAESSPEAEREHDG